MHVTGSNDFSFCTLLGELALYKLNFGIIFYQWCDFVGLVRGTLKILKQFLVLSEVRNKDIVYELVGKPAEEKPGQSLLPTAVGRWSGAPEQRTLFSPTSHSWALVLRVTSSQFSLQQSAVPAPSYLFSLFSMPCSVHFSEALSVLTQPLTHIAIPWWFLRPTHVRSLVRTWDARKKSDFFL